MNGSAASLPTAELGADAGHGNLLGVQTALTHRDYADGETLRARLRQPLDTARARGWVGPRTVVVFPEYIGTWLVVAGALPGVFAASTVAGAMRRLIAAQPAAFVRALLAGWRVGRRGRRAPFDAPRAALFRMQAAQMARLYQEVFGGLAQEFGVTVVAGSVVLPAPLVTLGRIQPGAGPLQNVSVVFGSDGRPAPRLARKSFLIREEQGFTAPAPVAALPGFDTPTGRLGVLVCADAWFPAPYVQLRAAGAEWLAVPSFLSPAGSWTQPWGGYNGAAAPPDVAADDVGRLTEGEAWRRYGMAGHMAAAGVRAGVNVFARGAWWDMTSDGRSLAVCDGEVAEVPAQAEEALLNVWLPG